MGRVDDKNLTDESDLPSYFNQLEREGYRIAIMTISDSSKILQNCAGTLEKWGGVLLSENITDNSLYIIKNGVLDFSTDNLCWNKKIKLKNNVIRFKQSTDTAINHSLLANGIEQVANESGCYIVVYDSYTESLVEISHWIWDGNTAVRQIPDA